MAAPPRRRDDRVVVHLDYDCFYAQVVQNRAAPPGALAGRCVGVTQKSLLATCNYEARRRGVRKLMRIADARRVCPDLVLVDGEDLSPFRDASKQLHRLVRTVLGTAVPLERLGLDELFVDATALVDANADRLWTAAYGQDSPPASQADGDAAAAAAAAAAGAVLRDAFFELPDADDEASRGFSVDARDFSGCVVRGGAGGGLPPALARAHLRLRLGSHLAAHLRQRLEHEAGYTASAGIATSKLLSKLAGKQNRPADQTTLVSMDAGDDAVVARFMDVLPLRSVPGIGFQTSRLLAAHWAARKEAARAETGPGAGGHEGGDADGDTNGVASTPALTVADIRTLPGMSPLLLDTVLGSRSSSSGRTITAAAAAAAAAALPSGARVWALLHGFDDTPVRGGRGGPDLLPTQISIEDTYAGPRQGLLRPGAAAAADDGAIAAELQKLATSLLRRMHVDLAGPGGPAADAGWLARPRTLRLTMRPQWAPGVRDSWRNVNSHSGGYDFARMSRSQPLPGFVLSRTAPPAHTAARLVAAHLLPMFRRLAAAVRVAGDRPWTVGLLNVCVANMVPVAGRGGDIAALLRRPDGQDGPDDGPGPQESGGDDDDDADDDDDDDDDGDNGGSDGWGQGAPGGAIEVCGQCGHALPPFARAAHARYHLLGD